ncbi:DNA-binding beta-propeller fold protein YncE [Catenulispora sp. MAP12-49]|uniref:YncE family protein n=1 Tax=Catenulispora sp. MAP12-49 TaxID=3156302 RepID=UPI003510EF7E
MTEIDVPTGNILRNLAVDAGVTTMMIPPDGSHVYLFGDSTSETVAYLDTATGEFGTPIEVGETPTDIDFTPDGKEALVLVTSQNGGTPGTTVVGLHVPADTPAFSARILPGFAFFTGHQL